MAPGATGLRPASGTARGSAIAVGVSAAVGVLAALVNLGAVSEAEDYLDNPTAATADALDDATGVADLLGVLSLAAQVSAAVFTLIWAYRVLDNHRRLGRQTTWGGGWGVGGWFLPPMIYVIPLLMLREAWKASEPDVPGSDQRWKQTPDSPVLWTWWILYVPVQLLLTVVTVSSVMQQFSFSTDTDEMRENAAKAIRDGATWSLVQSVVLVAAAVAWILLVRQITERHERLAGLDRR